MLNRHRCAYCFANRTSHPERRLFSFPKNPDICKAWVLACNKPSITEKTLQQLHTSYKLCSEHFLPTDYASCMMYRLKQSACPSVFQSGSSINKDVLKEKLKAKLTENSTNDEGDQLYMNTTESFVSPIITSTPKRKLQETSNVASKRLKILDDDHSQEINLSVARIITPKTRKIQIISSQLYYWRRKYQKLSSSEIAMKTALKTVKENVSPIVYRFIESQVKSAKVSMRGRRYTIEDKNLAIQLYLASPRAYKFLRKHFTLPSRRTLFNCISHIKTQSGFSEAILNALKMIASKMHQRDKLCVISLDEMKIT